VWVLVANNTFNGLAISAILKFANNLVRVFAHASAMMFTMVLEVIFMGAPATPQVRDRGLLMISASFKHMPAGTFLQLTVGASVVAISNYLYNTAPPPKPLAAAPTSPRAEEEAALDSFGHASPPRLLISASDDGLALGKFADPSTPAASPPIAEPSRARKAAEVLDQDL
jgi:hypothetical protein